MVAGLGVLNDVTITQASAIWQLNEVSPELTWRELYRRGMSVGRDHIASTVYTIVFAYAGAALPLLLLFELYSRPFIVSPVQLGGGGGGHPHPRRRDRPGARRAADDGGRGLLREGGDTEAGAATERRMTALRARFAR